MASSFKLLRLCARNWINVNARFIGTQAPLPVTKSVLKTMDEDVQPQPTSPPILNHRRPDETLEVLRKEFAKIGDGNMVLFKDDTTGIATLTIDQPQRRNSLSGRMMAQFSDKIAELERWEQVCITQRPRCCLIARV